MTVWTFVKSHRPGYDDEAMLLFDKRIFNMHLLAKIMAKGAEHFHCLVTAEPFHFEVFEEWVTYWRGLTGGDESNEQQTSALADLKAKKDAAATTQSVAQVSVSGSVSMANEQLDNGPTMQEGLENSL